MNTCPNCGKIAGLHSSILQGCMCQYSTKALPQREWQKLNAADMRELGISSIRLEMAKAIEAKLREKNA